MRDKTVKSFLGNWTTAETVDTKGISLESVLLSRNVKFSRPGKAIELKLSRNLSHMQIH